MLLHTHTHSLSLSLSLKSFCTAHFAGWGKRRKTRSRRRKFHCPSVNSGRTNASRKMGGWWEWPDKPIRDRSRQNVINRIDNTDCRKPSSCPSSSHASLVLSPSAVRGQTGDSPSSDRRRGCSVLSVCRVNRVPRGQSKLGLHRERDDVLLGPLRVNKVP